MSCSLGRKQRKRKYKEEVISDQSHSFLRDLTYKQQTFLYDGLHTDLLPHVRANSRLAVLAATSASEDRHGRAQWICLSCFSCTMRLLGAVQGICRVSKNSMSKEKTQFFQYNCSSQWRIFMKGLLFLSLSLLCILYLHFCKQGTCFLFFFYFFPPNRLLLRDFCNSFQFSWDSTCYSKRSIEIQFSENLSILEQGLLNCGIVSQGCSGSDFACNIWNCWNKTLEITESRANEIFAGTELGFGRQERSMEAVLIFLFFKYPTSNSGYTRNECFLFFKKRKSQKKTTYVKEYMCSPPTV